jgi:hypothetical protein
MKDATDDSLRGRKQGFEEHQEHQECWGVNADRHSVTRICASKWRFSLVFSPYCSVKMGFSFHRWACRFKGCYSGTVSLLS